MLTRAESLELFLRVDDSRKLALAPLRCCLHALHSILWTSRAAPANVCMPVQLPGIVALPHLVI